MGKYRRQARKKIKHDSDRLDSKRSLNRRTYSQTAKPLLRKKEGLRQTTKPQQDHRKVKFGKLDKVLLVGEGDFSFAQSLVSHHQFSTVIATCYDTEDQLKAKYPQTVEILDFLRARHVSSSDAGQTNETQWAGFSPAPVSDVDDDNGGGSNLSTTPNKRNDVQVHFGIDATRLSSTHKKLLRAKTPFTKIVFNFPHVGGLSTDVNRQVRSNQELLVGFFNAAKSLLSSFSNPSVVWVDPDDLVNYNDKDYEDATGFVKVPVGGQILVTLFEGEPYTLWNIRDLARHCGLQVIESFKFPWAAYPGYRHARTVGNITNGKDRSLEGKRVGAWRGEERDARCYVLQVKDENVGDNDRSSQRKDKKRKRTDKNGSEESDSDLE